MVRHQYRRFILQGINEKEERRRATQSFTHNRHAEWQKRSLCPGFF